ncbi:dienelactone hydrolase family protein [Pseudonocardia sp. CA-107938]|uniref:dienelactone hydrolase family protein n=1 Tax=Pseudonocardia sp. CA-107938 TaxID=3240021 RepID=UPI003D915491
MSTGSYEKITAADGGTFDAYRAGESGPGVLVFQEIFGINDNIRGLCDRLAEAGFLALAPDVFWRIEPRFERADESGMAEGMAHVQQLDFAQVESDLTATMAHLLALPGCSGKVGGVGFCLGGTLAFLCAAGCRVDGKGPDAMVSYYGSAIGQLLDRASSIECPMLFHYGDEDPYIPADQVAAVEAAMADKDARFEHYAAGHAFSNWDAPTLYNEAAAAQAWPRTIAFLHEHLDG